MDAKQIFGPIQIHPKQSFFNKSDKFISSNI